MLRFHARYSFLLAATVCLTVGAAPADTQSGTPINGKTIDVGIAALDGIVNEIKMRSGVPGIAVAVVHDGKVVFAKGYGVRRIGAGERVDPNTVFQVASVSKSISSSVVAAAIGDGKIKWGTPVAKYVPNFTLADRWVGSHVTIADMFAHRSGLPDYAGDDLEDLGYTRAQILSKLALLPLGEFRAAYHYTNFGLTAGAQAAANAEGRSWQALASEKIFQPLGMSHTSYRFADYARQSDRATLHVGAHASWKISARDADAQAPAGGLSSTVLDLAKWMTMEMDLGMYDGKRVVDRDALVASWQPQIVSNPPTNPEGRPGFYGEGLNVNYDAAGMLHLSHSGAFSMGAATVYEMLPAAKLGIVVLTNGTPSGVPESIAKMFYDTIEFGKIQRDWYGMYSAAFAQLLGPQGGLAGKEPPLHPAAALALRAYTGSYANRYFGAARVLLKNGQLMVIAGPKPLRYVLHHWNGNEFWTLPTSESEARSLISFTKTKRGQMAMTVEFLNENRLGTFTRVRG